MASKLPPPLKRQHKSAQRIGIRTILPGFVALALLAGCATTKVETTGTPPQQPLCQVGEPAVSTLVYWAPQWRPDQKEPQLREAAALRGIEDFFNRAGCIAIAGIHRLPEEKPLPTNEALVRLASNSTPVPERVVLIVVRELGPRMTIGIPKIVEGGTEVLIDVRVLNPTTKESLTNTQTLWRNGGTFVIKGVKTLDQDMSATLKAALMPEQAAR